jgi:ATP-dependent exoDNAse (exonuclease V) alpha subunit
MDRDYWSPRPPRAAHRGREGVCGLGVENGTRGTVEQIDRERGALAVATDRGDRVTLTRRYLEAGNVRHGYALTGHSGQGITVERAFVLGKGEARLQEWGYVALSRAREATRLYITGTPQECESQFHGAR